MRSRDGELFWLVLIIVVGTLLFVVCSKPKADLCEDRGGVYLWRDGACVDAPDEGDR